MQMARLRELALTGGILGEFAGRLAPVRDIAQWLAATTHLLERLLRTTAGIDACPSSCAHAVRCEQALSCVAWASQTGPSPPPWCRADAANLHNVRVGALHTYCAVLYDMHVGVELACVPTQLLRTADDAAAVTQLLLHGVAAGTAALQAGDTQGWPLLSTTLSVLRRMCIDGSTAAARTMGSSLRGSGGETPRPVAQLLAEAVAAFPRKVATSCDTLQAALDACLSAAGVLAALYGHKGRSPAAGDHPAAILLPADWDALASCAKLAPLLQQAATAAAQMGDSVTVHLCGSTAEKLLMILYIFFPMAFSSLRELAQWCELVGASWRLLAIAAATPQLSEQQRSEALMATYELGRCFELAVSGCLPPLPMAFLRDREVRRRRGVSTAARPAWDAQPQPLLQLSRQLCRAAHSVAKGGCAPPVAVALVQDNMPLFIGSFLNFLLRLLAKESSLR